MPRTRQLWALAAVASGVLLALLFGWSLPGRYDYGPPPGPAIAAPNAIITPTVALEDLSGVVAPRTEGSPKLESVLTQLVTNYTLGGLAQASAFSEARSIALAGELVRLVATTKSGQEKEAVEAISVLSGLVEATYGNEIQFSAPLPALLAIADLPSVSYVAQPNYPVAQAVTSEGVNVVGANAWRAAGIRGKGVKVGVLDTGFAGYTSLLGSELPPSVTARSFRSDGDISGGGEVHGTAVAEIIYDVAPEADLNFANLRTTVEMGNAVDWLIAQGVSIISASIGSSCSAPGDGTGTSNDMVAKARQAGVLWVNASGNEGEKHWSGFFSDTDGDGWHNYTPTDEGNTIQLTAGMEVTICLMWDDWTQRTQDFDLYLARSSTGTIVARSENTQAGSLPPVERIEYTVPADGRYYIAIKKYRATRNVDFDLFVEPVKLVEYKVAAKSILGSIPADSPNALTVGATYWKDDKLESYSSQGPTKDGRTKPDLAAPTGVSTQSYQAQGTSEFHGTSSSTPHVSGGAALVKSAFPSYGPAELQAYLEARALDLGPTGKDNEYGSGRLRLPVYAAQFVSQSFPVTMTVGQQVTASVQLRNTGGTTWQRGGANPVRLGTSQPKDRASALYTAGNWLSPSRLAAPDQTTVAPGQTGSFTFVLTAPSGGGTYTEYFQPVVEGQAWLEEPVVWFRVFVLLPSSAVPHSRYLPLVSKQTAGW